MSHYAKQFRCVHFAAHSFFFDIDFVGCMQKATEHEREDQARDSEKWQTKKNRAMSIVVLKIYEPF